MNPLRRCRAGFTLTEILMATGILGIGLTMVASVFPVAIDQSRRSQEITMAALSARSVAAAMRANRGVLLPWLRKNARGDALGDAVWPPWEITRNQWAKIPGTTRSYNPSFFLYYSGEVSTGTVTPNPGEPPTPPRHDVTRTYVNFQRGTTGSGGITTGLDSTGAVWMAGGYVPVVIATPLDGNRQGSNPMIGGPWLLTIVIYKSQGIPPPSVDYMACEQLGPDGKSKRPDRYMKAWVCKEGTGYPFRGAAGTYVLNWEGDITDVTPGTNPSRTPTRRNPTSDWLSVKNAYHGEAYLIESVTPDLSGNLTVLTPDKVTFAATGLVNVPSTYNKVSQTSTNVVQCVTLPGAIAVYHTVIGD